jgi:hypothetical protein
MKRYICKKIDVHKNLCIKYDFLELECLKDF